MAITFQKRQKELKRLEKAERRAQKGLPIVRKSIFPPMDQVLPATNRGRQSEPNLPSQPGKTDLRGLTQPVFPWRVRST